MPSVSRVRAILCLGLVPVLSGVAAAQGGAAASLDSLLNTRVSAASKYAQRTAAAPASVTIVTADEIRQYGFRDLRDILETVRGFYVSDDANYVNLGTRGFSRPGDYNNRILLLIDGHTINDQTWGGAPIGSELPIRLDAVERIEVVRGPGSALYGTNAMFAVINVVTRTGTEMDGVSVSPRAGAYGTRELGVSAGKPIGSRGAVAASGLITRTDGRDFYFPQLDAPATNGGRSSGLDHESAIGGLGTLVWRDLTARIGYRSREKGIPTGAFLISLDDPRAKSVDETFWGSIQLTRELGSTRRATVRAYADRYRYHGVYPEAIGVTPYTDGGGSGDVGGEALLLWDPSSRHRLTIGTEYRRAVRSNYYEGQSDGTTSSDDSPFSVASFFAQSEYELTRSANLTLGARYDHQRDTEWALTPRAALVINRNGTTAKLLYGEGFRVASSAEAWLATSYYSRNPSLASERIRTAELELQRRQGDHWLLTGSLYRYAMRDLIEQVDEGPDGVVFRNLASVATDGLELQAEMIDVGALSGRAYYAWQRAEDESTGARLSNSPRQIASVMATARATGALSIAGILRHEGGRLTLDGGSTAAFTRTDINVRYAVVRASPGRGREAVISLRIGNAFDTAWATPGGLEHRQSSIPQSGRTWLLRVDLRF